MEDEKEQERLAPVYQAWISIRGVVQAEACLCLEEAQDWIIAKVEEVEAVHYFGIDTFRPQNKPA
jgi:hypothetical protein